MKNDQSEDLQLEWLSQLASQLVAKFWPETGFVDVQGIIKSLDIEFEVIFDPSIKFDSGAALLTESGNWKINVLKRQNKQNGYQRLSPRDRFTIAHELAHIFLSKKFGFHPSSVDADYQRCEMLCDQFAGMLLFPNSCLNGIRRDSPANFFDDIAKRAQDLDISLVAAARRVAKVIPQFAIFQSKLMKNAAGQEVAKVIWSANSLSDYKISDYQHLRMDNSIGKLILEFHKETLNHARFYEREQQMLSLQSRPLISGEIITTIISKVYR